MEKSEAYQKAINLGKLLVKELEMEPGVDTLGRWMAHYLALKMTEVENTDGEKKSALEKECFDLILKIWSHRWKLPGNANPIKNFEPIFEFLAKLNPERKQSFYFDDVLTRKTKKTVRKLSKSDSWLQLAKDADVYARTCIDQALHNAAAELNSSEQNEYLENLPRLTEDTDVKIIRFVLHNEKDTDLLDSTEESKEALMKKIETEKLQSNIELLKGFRKNHLKLIKTLEQKLTEVTERNNS